MAIALRGELENNRDSKVFTEALNNNVQGYYDLDDLILSF
jgi:hypothetical protein